MKTIKRLSAILLIASIMLTALTGCGGKGRKLFNKVDLGDYVEVGEYKGVEVDTTTDGFKEYYDSLVSEDVTNGNFYNEVTEGAVQNGDIANIDYVGKIDGVAFDGGTAQGYDLTIGSKSFIDDFEEELIGVKVGETKDVTAKFPDQYSNSPDLAGKEAIFTVTVNYIKVAQEPKDFYKKMNFATVDAYVKNRTETAIKNYLFNAVGRTSKVKDYPEEDKKVLNEQIYEYYVDIYKSQGVDLEEYVNYYGYTLDQYRDEVIAEQTVPSFMDTAMITYYIFDAEGLEIDDESIEAQKIDQPAIAESYTVQDVVLDYLYDNAKIKK